MWNLTRKYTLAGMSRFGSVAEAPLFEREAIVSSATQSLSYNSEFTFCHRALWRLSSCCSKFAFLFWRILSPAIPSLIADSDTNEGESNIWLLLFKVAWRSAIWSSRFNFPWEDLCRSSRLWVWCFTLGWMKWQVSVFFWICSSETTVEHWVDCREQSVKPWGDE